MKEPKLTKSHNHDHFWVSDNILYESYNTIRGMRFREKFTVMLPDMDNVPERTIELINEGIIPTDLN